MSFNFVLPDKVNFRNGRHENCDKCCSNEARGGFSRTPGRRKIRQMGRGM